MTLQTDYLTTKIPENMAGWRLDKALAALFPDYSRARLQQWIKAGQVQVNAQCLRAKDKVQGGEQVAIQATVDEVVAWSAQALPLDVLYEDEDMLVINKPVGWVVHPGTGNPDGTLVNALLHRIPALAQLPRAGLVHRLDKDTSGVLVVACSVLAHTRLVAQLQARAFLREYQAVVNGVLVAGGRIDAPIGRHPTQRVRMAVVASGKPAVTHYRVMQRYRAHTLLRVKLETGRTHQIRVHLSHQGYPLVGDSLYGHRLRLPVGSEADFQQVLRNFNRQALHAERLGLNHPRSGEWLEWAVPLPTDMQQLLAGLVQDREQGTF